MFKEFSHFNIAHCHNNVYGPLHAMCSLYTEESEIKLYNTIQLSCNRFDEYMNEL